jgi:zinc transporter ZupT
MARRAADQKKSDRAVAATTQVASFAVLIAFAVTIVAVLEGPAGFAPLAPFTRDVIGPFSWLELAGFALVAWVGFVMWKRLRK